MPEFKVTISGEALRRLAETAVSERRPLDLQAEVLVLRQLGCWPHDGDRSAVSVRQEVLDGQLS